MNTLARFIVRWQTAIVAALLLLSTVYVVNKIETDRSAADHKTCIETADARRTFRVLLHQVAFPPPASSAGLTQLPSFPPLDPATRQYLQDLDRQLAHNNGSPYLQNIYRAYVKKVPIPRCN